MGNAFKALRPDQIAEVETLAAVLTAQQMADYFGIGRTTFFALIERDPEIGERYKRGKARAVGSVAQSLIAKARAGNVIAMIFYLKTQGGWRETQEIEHVAIDRITRVIVDPVERDAKDFVARIKQLQAHAGSRESLIEADGA